MNITNMLRVATDVREQWFALIEATRTDLGSELLTHVEYQQIAKRLNDVDNSRHWRAWEVRAMHAVPLRWPHWRSLMSERRGGIARVNSVHTLMRAASKDEWAATLEAMIAADRWSISLYEVTRPWPPKPRPQITADDDFAEEVHLALSALSSMAALLRNNVMDSAAVHEGIARIDDALGVVAALTQIEEAAA